MKNLPANNSNNPLANIFGDDETPGLLRNPGDELVAKVTKSGRQVVKTNINGEKNSATRYPTTGSVVKTNSSKPKK